MQVGTDVKFKVGDKAVYPAHGVGAARVWQWPEENGMKRIAVAVRPSPRASPQELLQRVEAAVSGLREPDELWEFGLLET